VNTKHWIIIDAFYKRLNIAEIFVR